MTRADREKYIAYKVRADFERRDLEEAEKWIEKAIEEITEDWIDREVVSFEISFDYELHRLVYPYAEKAKAEYEEEEYNKRFTSQREYDENTKWLY